MKKLSVSIQLLCLAATMWGADRPLTLSGGGGTADNPYLVATKADLIELAEACNTPEGTATNGTTASHYKDVYFKMTADIDLGGDSEFGGIAVAPAQFSPGTTWKFQGTFDGDGHTISGLNIRGTTFTAEGKAETAGANRSRSYVGLFGYLEGATVRNINLSSDCHVDGYANVGSIAGQADKGAIIENCSSLATVDGYDSAVGGIVGRASAAKATPTTITGCYFGGTARTCNSNVGGIAGYASNQYLTISGCTNTGAVTAESFNSIKAEGVQSGAGGIVGTFSGLMDNCFNSGPVTASKEKAGGLAGAYSGTSSLISVSINLGAVSSPAVTSTGVLAGTATGKFDNCTFDSNMWGVNAAANKEFDGAAALPTATLTSGTLPAGFDAAMWTAESGFYPRPTTHDCDAVKRAAATYLTFTDGQGALDFKTTAMVSAAMPGITAAITEGEDYFTTDGTTITVKNLTEISEGKVRLTNGTYTLEVPLVGVPTYFSGSGTETDPYIIDSKRALMGLAKLCNGVKMEHFAGKYFRQTADIDLTGEAAFIGIAVNTAYCTPANMLRYFCGTYDGGGHTISGITINGVVLKDDGTPDSTPSYASTGLFGAIRGGAVIKNVNLDASCSFTGYNSVGSIAGEMGEESSVSNCTSAASVTAWGNKAGGITGNTTAIVSSAVMTDFKIENCVYYGTVTCATNYVGGIIGNSLVTISGCVNGGTVVIKPLAEGATVNATAYAGGIAGCNAGIVTRSINLGTVRSAAKTTGGIAGQNTSSKKSGGVSQCINAGQVVGETLPGAVVGDDNISSTTTPDRSPNWYDEQYCTYAAIGNLGSGKGTHVTATPLTTATLTSGEAIEALDGFSLAKGRYPLPEALADNAAAVHIATTYMTMPAGESLSNFTQGTLAQGVTATVPDGETIFYVADGMVLARSVTGLTAGTITLGYDDYRRELDLKTLPGILPGNGTAGAPFELSSAADFATLAGAISESGFDYAGRHFVMTTDIDFTDATLMPVGSESRPFNGTFDGAGHTVRGIVNPAPDDVMQRDRALFGSVGAKGTVKNLTLASSDIRGNLHTAGIAALLAGHIENCSVTADCIIYSTPAPGDNSNPKVYTGDYAGAIAAYLHPTAVITGCTNAAKVVADHCAGGIAGGTTTTTGALITDCANSGEVGGVATPVELLSGNAMAGGIAGRFCGTISSCSNEGRVIATAMNDAGGIAGYAMPATTITDCVNSGKVEVNWLNGGGIAGMTDPDATAGAPVKVERCANHGVINAMSAGAGIIGYANQYTYVTDCHNTADIATREGASAAGIIAQTDGIINVSGCYNTGKIDSTRGSAGIVGEAFSPGLAVERCFNAGIVSASTTNDNVRPRAAAGIANSTAEGAVTISSCYNVAPVSALEYAGGIAGNATSATVTDCYNVGTVTAQSGAGNIAGLLSGTVMTACFTSEQCPTLGSDGDVTRLPEAELMQAALGDDFVYAKACLPRLQRLEWVPVAVINSARWLLDGDDTSDHVTRPLTLGMIDGLTWAVSGNAELEGDLVRPTTDGPFTLTATVDDLTAAYDFISAAATAGVADLAADVEIIGWLDLSGRPLTSPQTGTIAIALARDSSGAVIATKTVAP